MVNLNSKTISTILNIDNLNESTNLGNNNRASNILNSKINFKNEKPESIRKYKLINAILFNKTKYLFGKKIKYLLFALFVINLVFNFTYYVLNSNQKLPMKDLQPIESYLSKHLDYHYKYFELGPPVTINFIKPMNYWENQTYFKIRSFLNESKNLLGMTLTEINWIEETRMDIDKSINFYPECERPESAGCFYLAMQSVLSQDQNKDDVNFIIKNTSAPIDENNFVITSSRVYLQMKNFTGSTDDLNLMLQIKDLAEEKYNFGKDDLIIFSPIFIYLEQMNEIYPTFIAIFLISFECIFLGSFVLMFDLRTIFILIIVEISFFISILANMVMLEISLNIVTQMHLIMLPAFLFEFFYHKAYLFLFKVQSNKKLKFIRSLQSSVTTSSEFINFANGTIENKKFFNLIPKFWQSNKQLEKIKLKRLKFAFDKISTTSALFFLFIAIFSLNFMYYCTTYNFYTLYLLLLSICLNLFLHLSIFYPVILVLFGTCWINKKPNARFRTNTGNAI